MTKLPKSLDLESLMRKEAPADVTVGEMRRSLPSQDFWKALMRHTKGRAQLHVRWRATNEEVSDDMTLAEMRRGVANGTIAMSIDDGSGGELVD